MSTFIEKLTEISANKLVEISRTHFDYAKRVQLIIEDGRIMYPSKPVKNIDTFTILSNGKSILCQIPMQCGTYILDVNRTHIGRRHAVVFIVLPDKYYIIDCNGSDCSLMEFIKETISKLVRRDAICDIKYPKFHTKPQGFQGGCCISWCVAIRYMIELIGDVEMAVHILANEFDDDDRMRLLIEVVNQI